MAAEDIARINSKMLALGLEPIVEGKRKEFDLDDLVVGFDNKELTLPEWVNLYKDKPPQELVIAAAKAEVRRYGLDDYKEGLYGIKAYFNLSKY